MIDKLQHFIFSPIILTPLVLIIANRFMSYFHLDWDKLYATNFEKIKNKVIDSIGFTLLICVLILMNYISNENLSFSDFLQINLNHYNQYVLLPFTVFIIFISVFLMYDTFLNNILPRKKILVYLSDGEYIAQKGHDSSLHLTKSNNKIDLSQSKKIGKTFLDESIIDYQIVKTHSVINEYILKSINESMYDPFISIQMRAWVKTIVLLICSLVVTGIWSLFYANLYYESGLWIVNGSVCLTCFILMEILSVIYVPILFKIRPFSISLKFLGISIA